MRANQGSTMFITQTMSEAESLCDRIAIMVNGGLCCITETEKLKKLVGGYNLKIILKSKSQQQNSLKKSPLKQQTSKKNISPDGRDGYFGENSENIDNEDLNENIRSSIKNEIEGEMLDEENIPLSKRETY